METIAGAVTETNQSGNSTQQSEPPISFHWCHEVELATVSGLWHHPEFFELAHEELDFDLHFTVPKHRTLLRAIEAIYSWSCSEGIPNYTSVVHLIRETCQFEECGGHQGINEVFDYAYYNAGCYQEVVLREHIRLLKEYAFARAIDPFKAVKYYSGGRATLRRNKLASHDRHSVIVGEGIWEGVRFRVAGWPHGADKMALKLERI
jgi:hypothetical protein